MMHIAETKGSAMMRVPGAGTYNPYRPTTEGTKRENVRDCGLWLNQEWAGYLDKNIGADPRITAELAEWRDNV
jgi:hypothetical protein